MRSVDALITQIRLQTDTRTYTTTSGTQQQEFVQYLNDAQDRLQSVIMSRIPLCSYFDTTYTQSIVAAQQAYPISSLGDVFSHNMVRLVEFSYDSQTVNFGKVKRGFLFELSNQQSTYPWLYDVRGSNVLLSPVPQSAVGSLRTTYPRRLDNLDVRRARVNGTPATTDIDLTSSTFGAPSAADEALFVEGAYFCISDIDGNVMLYNGKISSYNATTDVITAAANISTYLTGSYTLANLANGYLTLGKFSTTHSKLPDESEKFLIAYTHWKIKKRESSNDSGEQGGELDSMEKDVLSAVGGYVLDYYDVPILNEEWLY